MQCHSSDFGLDSWRFNASLEGNGTGETLVVGTRLNKNGHWAHQLRIGTQQTRRPRRNGGGWCRALRTLVVDSRRPCAVSAHRPQDLLSPFAVVDHEAAINDASMLQYGWKRSTMGPFKTSEDQTGQLCDPAARLTPPKKSQQRVIQHFGRSRSRQEAKSSKSLKMREVTPCFQSGTRGQRLQVRSWQGPDNVHVPAALNLLRKVDVRKMRATHI